jgi:hypothetical protein
LPGRRPSCHRRLLFSIFGIGKGRQDVLPAPFFIAIFHTIGLLSLPKNKIRAGKLLIDSVQLQEERLGGRPHYRYRRARRHRPVVDRVLQKNIQIADDHG